MHRIYRKRQTEGVRDVVARVDGAGVEMPAGDRAQVCLPGEGGEARRGEEKACVGMGMGIRAWEGYGCMRMAWV